MAGAISLVPCHVVKSLQFIWRLGTSRCNLRVHNLQMSCSDLIQIEGLRKVVPVMATRVTCPIYSWCISMALRKTAVTPLLMHWSYCSLALSHDMMSQIRLLLYTLHAFLVTKFSHPPLQVIQVTVFNVWDECPHSVSQLKQVIPIVATRSLWDIDLLSHGLHVTGTQEVGVRLQPDVDVEGEGWQGGGVRMEGDRQHLVAALLPQVQVTYHKLLLLWWDLIGHAPHLLLKTGRDMG